MECDCDASTIAVQGGNNLLTVFQQLCNHHFILEDVRDRERSFSLEASISLARRFPAKSRNMPNSSSNNICFGYARLDGLALIDVAHALCMLVGGDAHPANICGDVSKLRSLDKGG